MKIILSGVNPFSGNRGIEALTNGILRLFATKKIAKISLFIPVNHEVHPVIFNNFKKSHNVQIIRYYTISLLISLIASYIYKYIPIFRRFILSWFGIIREFNNSDCILTLNEGDGFTDLYGKMRLLAYSADMQIAINLGKPLILAPQTLGPFSTTIGSIFASKIIRKARLVFVREMVSKFIANYYHAKQIIACPDLAFLLPADQEIKFKPMIENFICVNVSGLLWEKSKEKSANVKNLSYRDLLEEIIVWFLGNTNLDIFLIPHTYSVHQCDFDDLIACRKIHENIHSSRVHLMEENLSASQIKGIIARSEFFIGSRMHACIAALSSSVPSFGIGYSHKFSGIFNLLGLKENFTILEKENTTNILFKIIKAFKERKIFKSHLEKTNQELLKEIYSKDIIPRDLTENNTEVLERIPKNIANIVKLDLCSECGICQAVCPVSAIKIQERTRNYPEIDESKCISCRVCIDSCPSFYEKYFMPLEPSEMRYSPEIGYYIKAFTGYSADKILRRNGSSGGIGKTIIRFLLTRDLVDGVITVSKKTGNPFIVKTVERVNEVSNSLYHPVSTCTILKNILKNDNKTYAFIGKPCEVEAVRILQERIPYMQEKIPYCISIFCHHVPNRKATSTLLKYLRIPIEKIREIRYRGDGWPGNFQVILNTEQIYKIPYKKAWNDFLSNNDYNHLRCSLCPDSTGELAEISIGDAWGLEDQEKLGVSFIITRNNRGKELIEKMKELGWIEISKDDSRVVNGFQPHLILKKIRYYNYSLVQNLFGMSFFNRDLFTSTEILQKKSIFSKIPSLIRMLFYFVRNRKWIFT